MTELTDKEVDRHLTEAQAILRGGRPRKEDARYLWYIMNILANNVIHLNSRIKCLESEIRSERSRPEKHVKE